MDSLGDFLTRIRNAGMARHEKVDVPSSNLRVGVANILKETGYIRDFKVAKDSKQGIMRIYLRYNSKNRHVIQRIYRVSKPGRRSYVSSDKIPSVRNGFGLAILSTNKGIMSGDEARKQNAGGEVLCKLW